MFLLAYASEPIWDQKVPNRPKKCHKLLYWKLHFWWSNYKSGNTANWITTQMAVMEFLGQNWNFTLRKTVLKWAVLSSLLHYMNLWIILKNSGPVRLLIPTYPIFSWNYPNLWLFLIFKIREKWQLLNIIWHIYILYNIDNLNWIEKRIKMDSLQSAT